jgi:predicted transcriptional regulator
MRKNNRIIKGVSETSRLSYHELLKSGQKTKETEYVYSLLKELNRPMNSREISIRSGIERSSITRVLYDLIDSDLIKVCNVGKCHITKRVVKFYLCND